MSDGMDPQVLISWDRDGGACGNLWSKGAEGG